MRRSRFFLVGLLVAVHGFGCGRSSLLGAPLDDAGDGDGRGGDVDGGGNDGKGGVEADGGNPITDGGGPDSSEDAGAGYDGDDAGAGYDGEVPTIAPFPLGAYDRCVLTTFLQTPGGGGETDYGGSVSLSQSGTELSVTYGGDGGALDATFVFSETSAASGTLEPGQQVAGVQVACAPLEFAEGVMELTAGSLTYDEGALFLAVVGAVDPVDAGGGCSNPGGQAAIAITCSGAPAPSSLAVGIDAGTTGAGFGDELVGVYSCASSVVSSSSVEVLAGGGTGTLTITETDGVVVAAYAKDPFVEGTLAFVATTAGAAFPAAPNESVAISCDLATQPGGPQTITMPVTGSTLTIDGTSVVLSLAGTMPEGGPCGGNEANVSVVCTK